MPTNIPSAPKGVIALFSAGYTGVDVHAIEEVEIFDDLLCLTVSSYFNPEIEKFNSDFFVKGENFGATTLFFEFPEGGFEFLGKGAGPFGDGKALYADFMDECGNNDPVPPGGWEAAKALWKAERENEKNEAEENFA